MTGKTLINTPIVPLIISSGKNAKIVVSVAVRTAGNISDAPSIDASFGLFPISTVSIDIFCYNNSLVY